MGAALVSGVDAMRPREVRRWLARRGFVSLGGSKHEKWLHEGTGYMTLVPWGSKGSHDPRAWRNELAAMRRAGVPVDE